MGFPRPGPLSLRRKRVSKWTKSKTSVGRCGGGKVSGPAPAAEPASRPLEGRGQDSGVPWGLSWLQRSSVRRGRPQLEGRARGSLSPPSLGEDQPIGPGRWRKLARGSPQKGFLLFATWHGGTRKALEIVFPLKAHLRGFPGYRPASPSPARGGHRARRSFLPHQLLRSLGRSGLRVGPRCVSSPGGGGTWGGARGRDPGSCAWPGAGRHTLGRGTHLCVSSAPLPPQRLVSQASCLSVHMSGRFRFPCWLGGGCIEKGSVKAPG